MLVCKFVSLASALFCMYACMYVSALFYVDACMYCVCFVLYVCLYASLYAGVGVCALAGVRPPLYKKKLGQNCYDYVEGIDSPYVVEGLRQTCL